MKKLIVFTFLLFGLEGFAAGNEVGNGGDVVICTASDENKTYTILDYYERKEDQFKIEEFDLEDEYQVALKAINKLEKIAPRLHEKYTRDLKNFRLKVKFKKGQEFRDIKDSFHVSVGKNCEIKQVAHQRKNMLSKDTEVFMNKDLYEKLSAFQKGMLITHEIIYEHFIYFGEITSKKVRLFNRYLYSEDIKSHKSRDFNKIGESLGIPLY